LGFIVGKLDLVCPLPFLVWMPFYSTVVVALPSGQNVLLPAT